MSIMQHLILLCQAMMLLINNEDEQKQICGQCGKMLRIQNTSRKLLREHHATKTCQNATPPIIR